MVGVVPHPLNPINDDGAGHLVISDAVTRIRTTTDPNEIAQAGELLIVLES